MTSCVKTSVVRAPAVINYRRCVKEEHVILEVVTSHLQRKPIIRVEKLWDAAFN